MTAAWEVRLRDDETARFEWILAAVLHDVAGVPAAAFQGWDGDGTRVALARSALDGKECALIVGVTDLGDGEVLMTPLAVLVDEALGDRLADPTGEGQPLSPWRRE